ncbi:MAG: hypothetical protein ACR2LP_01195 [Candidatus Limnocylindrales bacterium]
MAASGPPVTRRAPSPAPSQATSAEASALTGLARSDAFWVPLTYQAVFIDQFESLDAMVERTDLIVVGRVVGIELDRIHEAPGGIDFHFMTVTVETDAVLSGSVETLTPGQIEVELFLPDFSKLDQLRANLPDHRHLLFLLNAGLTAQRHERPEEEWEAGRFTYLPPNFQAVLRDIDGQVHRVPMAPDDLAGFPSGLEGDDFDALVERVRQLGDG